MTESILSVIVFYFYGLNVLSKREISMTITGSLTARSLFYGLEKSLKKPACISVQ